MRLEKRLVDDFGEESKWTERAKKIANDMREELEQYLRDSSAV
jgi:hypothetical protein